jgi:tetratricopeptide (TPR) repeat protein
MDLYKSYNSYDSMGEFYFNEGDMENASIYYKKAIEMYPTARSANSMLNRIEELN